MSSPKPKNTSEVRLSVVAPCHNEVTNLKALNERVSKACQEVVGNEFEIILVDDGSIDNTWAEISKLAVEHPYIKGVNLSRNFDHQLALSAGLYSCVGERILIIDADLQDPPERLSEMMLLMDKGADVVYGKRTARHGDHPIRSLASTIFYRLLNKLSDVEIPADTGDFRLISRRILNVLLSMPEHHRYIRGLFSWIGFEQVPFYYERDHRFSGETSYNFRRLVTFSLDAITGFSMKPLRLVNFFGLTFIGFSVCLLFYLVWLWAFTLILVPGWLSLIAGILFVGGVQMIFLGLIGEYVGRIFEQTKDRPLFVIAKTTSDNEQER